MAFDLAMVPTGQPTTSRKCTGNFGGSSGSELPSSPFGSGCDNWVAILLKNEPPTDHAMMDQGVIDPLEACPGWLDMNPEDVYDPLLLLSMVDQLVPGPTLQLSEPAAYATVTPQTPCLVKSEEVKPFTAHWRLDPQAMDDAPCIHPLCLVASPNSEPIEPVPYDENPIYTSSDTSPLCSPEPLQELTHDASEAPMLLTAQTGSSCQAVHQTPLIQQQNVCEKETLDVCDAHMDPVKSTEAAEDEAVGTEELDREEEGGCEEKGLDQGQDDDYDPRLDTLSDSEDEEGWRRKKRTHRKETKKKAPRRQQTKRQAVEPDQRRSSTAYDVQTTYYLKSVFFETYGNNLKLSKAQRRQIQQQTGLKSRNITYWFSNHKRRFHTALQVFRHVVHETDGKVKTYRDFLQWRKHRNLPNEIMDHELNCAAMGD